MGKASPTMRDVAQLAGVSQATVSYVLNGTASISQEVKARVHAAIQALNYKPNYNAKALKTRSSDIVGVIIPDITNQYYARLLQILEEALHARNRRVVIYSTAYRPEIEENAIASLTACNAYAIITLYQFTNPKCWEQLRATRRPAVAIEGGSACAQYGIPCVNVDSHLGGYMAARHLLGLGRRRIAYVHQNSGIDALQERMSGYIEAMRAVGLFREEDIFVTRNPNDKWNEGKTLGKLLARCPYDGIITSSDLIAIGIIKELQACGRRVPDDVAVVGYDDVPVAELFIPALTTIAQPVNEICTLALEAIFRDERTSPLPTLQPQLIKRDSA